jgi:alpha-galactosidase
MQEEADEKSINLCITSARMSAEFMASAMRAWSMHTRAAKGSKKQAETHGKQSLKTLTESGAELAQIPIEKSGIADFSKEAKRFHVDYALVKDKSTEPPRYLVFFKAKNSAQLEQAFEAYSNRTLKKIEKERQEQAKQKSVTKEQPNHATKAKEGTEKVASRNKQRELERSR